MEISETLRLYLEALQTDIFLNIYKSVYDFYSFAKCFMKSKVCRNIDNLHSYWISQTPERILEEVIKEQGKLIKKKNNSYINKEAVIWLSSFYRRWHFITGEYSNVIVRFLSVNDGIKNYFMLHQLDEENAIEHAKRHYNLSRNTHRKYEVNEVLETMREYYDKPYYYEFLARRILKKLTRDGRLDKLVYTYNDDYYDFITNDKSIGLSTKVIGRQSNNSLIDIFKTTNEKAKYYKINTTTSIYFCFVFSEKYELNIESFFDDIKDLNESIALNERKYDYIYYYLLGHLVEINKAGEIFEYIMPFSKEERKGVISDLKKAALD